MAMRKLPAKDVYNLDAWSLNNREIETVNCELVGDIIEEMKVIVEQRPHFYYDRVSIKIPRYFYRFIGVHASIDDYLKWVSTLDSTLSSFGQFYLKITEGFDYTIPDTYLDKLDVVWQRIKLLADFKPDDIVSNMDLLKLLPNLASEVLTKQIRENLKALIEYYFEVNNDLIDEAEFKNMVYYTAFWINQYFEHLFENFDYINVNPKILFYGPIQPYEVFFLLFMSSLGCDIIYLNTLDDTSFDKVDPQNIFSYKHELVRKMKNVDFPSYTRNMRVETTARQAEAEVHEALYNENDGFYKPWQLSEHNLKVKTLETIYNEIPILIKTQALYRTGWDVVADTVALSNIFAKISGVPKNIKPYMKQIKEQIELPNTKFFNKTPISRIEFDEIKKFNEVIAYRNGNPYIQKDELLSAPWWPYMRLRQGLQKVMAEKICYIINENIILNRELQDSYEVMVQVFSKLLHVDNWLIELLMNFDYPLDVPKVIVYDYINSTNKGLSFSDAILLLLANGLGMDVIIYTPSGYLDIENYISPNLHLYDIHRLEAVDIDLEYKTGLGGIFKKIF